MTPFLKQITRHYCADGKDLDKMIFVLPSQRAVVFFRKYLSETVKEHALPPVLAPQVLSIDDFFVGMSQYRRADRILLLLRLYESYCSVAKDRGIVDLESLDQFIYWGGVILSDFDDVDKYLVDANDIFRNVAQYKEIQDDFSDLSDTQKEAMKSFLDLFNEDGEYKRRFSKTWNLLAPLYERFNEELKKEGLSYDGALYRDIVSQVEREGAAAVLEKAYPDCRKVIFCGLNALCECEKRVLGKLRDVSLAEFCWDYVSRWIQDSQNKSSHFMKDNVLEFPQAFPLESCDNTPEIEVVSVPSAVGQTKLLTSLLDLDEIPADEHTAILLPDESLLLPLLNSIPNRVQKVNVTMGFPMTSSSFYSLMDSVCQMQQNVRYKDGKPIFNHRWVWSIVGNNIFEALCDELTRERIVAMKKNRRYWVEAKDIQGTELLDLIFTSPLSETRTDGDNELIAKYLTDILNYIGRYIAGDEGLKKDFSLELDFAMEYVKTVNLLLSRNLPVEVPTWLRILRSLLQSKSIPFRGEPLQGLQIMGPLEIRALDFDKLFILSCNEAVFPRKNTSQSFIPALLRRGFSLPTYEYQDAVWAYYFYRMIQRPSKVWMLLDSRTEGLKSGEESRYIKQLEYSGEADLKRRVAMALPKVTPSDDCIVKTQEDINAMHTRAISPSALKQYLACPVQFYYSFIKGLQEEEEVEESMDAAIIGQVYHKSMEQLYKSIGTVIGENTRIVSMSDLDKARKNTDKIKNTVEYWIKKKMRTDEIHGRDIVMCRLIQKYVLATIDRDKEFLENKKLDKFTILGIEEPLESEIGNFKFKGIIDRWDSFEPGTMRVVDYKTGEVKKDDVEISDDKVDKIVENIFGGKTKNRPEIALQCFIYDYLLKSKGRDEGTLLVNSVYSTRKILQELPVEAPMNGKFYDAMLVRVQQLLEELDNPEVNFCRTEDTDTCEKCAFRTICGR